MIVFDGKAEANTRKLVVQQKINKFPHLKIFSLVFQEDRPSTIYTALKKKDAQAVGIAYDDVYLPIGTPVAEIQQLVRDAVAQQDVQGIIIQKPAKSLMPSETWWGEVVSALDPEKDVDGLTGKGKVLPATARAILEILKIAERELKTSARGKTALVLGRSDIVGRPAAAGLEKRDIKTQLFGRAELAKHPEALETADIIITATGQENLISASTLKQGAIVIDAGSPKPEVDLSHGSSNISFLSPVPGGVGPMTRVCLLENLLDLVQ
ncbi:MAG TPA: bifunctional 5,10-methylenetetrahydrofolate dehydrogenase/5,10-methenyltetrahydrofolate cyclohydrolase [Candidatus Saccharimonadia bacterium]|nr:bifunctional 5,10-methylenetetrahydrofolate dehydrogenase/5,10-methenyltetrahydrofolate cyclohydrolase [Candidatus Saccharimonadia bacterium]